MYNCIQASKSKKKASHVQEGIKLFLIYIRKYETTLFKSWKIMIFSQTRKKCKLR
jgi:hypothetical protein